MSPDRFPPPLETFCLPGHPGLWRRVSRVPDAYERNKSHCPHCGGLAVPWRGWIHCESDPPECGAVTWIETGEVLIPAQEIPTP